MMPETDLHVAGMVAEQLRRWIAGEPFAVNKGTKTHRRDDLDRAPRPWSSRARPSATCSSAPTPRSTAPSMTAAIAWWRKRRRSGVSSPRKRDSSTAVVLERKLAAVSVLRRTGATYGSPLSRRRRGVVVNPDARIRQQHARRLPRGARHRWDRLAPDPGAIEPSTRSVSWVASAVCVGDIELHQEIAKPDAAAFLEGDRDLPDRPILRCPVRQPR